MNGFKSGDIAGHSIRIKKNWNLEEYIFTGFYSSFPDCSFRSEKFKIKTKLVKLQKHSKSPLLKALKTSRICSPHFFFMFIHGVKLGYLGVYEPWEDRNSVKFPGEHLFRISCIQL